MNMNTIIRTDICKYEYEYYRAQKSRYAYGYENYKSMTIIAHMCYKIQLIVLCL